MRTITPLLIALLLIGCPPSDDAPASPPAPVSSESALAPAPVTSVPWAGKYTGERLDVTLKGTPKALTGSIQKAGKTFALTVKSVSGETLEGSFADQGASFDVTLRLDGDSLALTTAGTTYALKRFIPPNPLAAPNPLAKKPMPDPKTPPSDPQAPTAATADWIQWKSPLGHRFAYPREWTVQEIEGGIALLPPSQAKDDQGQPLEIFLCQAAPAGDIQQASDPRAIQALEQELGQLFPFLRRTSQPKPVNTACGEGITASYAGTNPKGQEVDATLYAVVVKGTALALVAAGLRTAIAGRMQTTRAIFETFDYKYEAKVDPRLVGQWRHTSTYTSGDFGMTSEEYLLLKADGTCYSGSQMMGGDAGSSFGSGDGSWKYKGVWSAANNRLDMRWDAGAVESESIYLEGNSMMFKRSKNKLWERVGR